MRRPPEPAVRKCPAGTSGPSAGHGFNGPAAALGIGHGLRASARCATGTESAPRARAPAQAAEAIPARVLSAATGPGTEEQRSSVLKLPLAATMQMPRCGNANAPGGTRLKLRTRE